MNYTKLGEFVESLMKKLVKGEIDEKEFVQSVHEKMEEEKMNKNGYAVTCPKCGSTDIKYDYDKTTYNTKTQKTKTPVKCNSCGYETEEIK